MAFALIAIYATYRDPDRSLYALSVMMASLTAIPLVVRDYFFGWRLAKA